MQYISFDKNRSQGGQGRSAELVTKRGGGGSSTCSEWGRAPFLDEKSADSVLPVGSVEK